MALRPKVKGLRMSYLRIRLGELDSWPCHTHRHPVKITKSYSLSLTITNDASVQALYLAHKDLKALALPTSLTSFPFLLPSVPALLFPLPLRLQPFTSISNPSKGWHLCSYCLFPFQRGKEQKLAVHRKNKCSGYIWTFPLTNAIGNTSQNNNEIQLYHKLAKIKIFYNTHSGKNVRI